MTEEVYAANVGALKKNQPSLVSILEEVDLENQDECIVVEGINNCKVLKVKKENGNYILYNSFYNPYKEAKEITGHIDYKINRSLIVAVGAGMGYHLQEVLNNLNEKSILLVVEKSKAVLKNLLYHVDFSQAILDKKMYFAVGDFEQDKLGVQLRGVLSTLFLNIFYTQPLTLPVLDINYIRYSKEVFKFIANYKTLKIFAVGNCLDDTILGIDNRIKNLPHIIENPGLRQFLERYRNAYKGKPAIVIASGPSLDKNIHLLKKVKGKALLLACDGSLESLKKHNIVPDVVSSVERIMLTYEAFYKNKEIPGETVLVAPPVVRPEIFQRFKTKTLSLFKDEYIAEVFNQMVYDKGKVWSGLCVAHQLCGLAQALGADPIILVGQDLAYSPDGVSHASEAPVKQKIDLKDVEYYVKDIHGNDIPTTFIWKQFLEAYQYFIEAYEGLCIDATEGGAYIQGTQVMTLDEAIKTYCTQEIPRFRDLVDSLEVEEEYICRAYKNVLRILIRLSKRTYLLKRKAQKSKLLNREAKRLLLRGISTQEELDKVYDALDYTEYRIVRYILEFPWLAMLFQYPITVCVRKVNELGSEITLDVLRKNLDVHMELLNTVEHYSAKLLDVLQSGFELVKGRASEILPEEEIGKLKCPGWIS